ncbi:MAG: glycosyltransferase family 2 protein [Candidatus Aenigmarchaeota archaeon]|nr:glycosyltransferase family 2 protein [Candidatus Aenigmarchaeota archaeon]
MARNKVSVVVLTLNEEENLQDCLESVKWADEIVIVDSFSTDKTINIAKKYKCKIYQKSFDGFGQLKNYAISKASHKWILNMDADERIPKDLRKEIENALSDEKYNGYYFPRKSYIGRKWLKGAGQYPSYQLRLFRKDKGKFENAIVHERVNMDGEIGYMKNDMIHYNFKSWSSFISKMNFLTTIEAKELTNKKFVVFYPLGKIKEFFGAFRKQRKKGSDMRTSYVLARRVLSDYEISWILPLRFISTFFRLYIFMKGFRDGFYGFMWASLVSMHMSVRHYKYHDMMNDNKKSY